MLAPERDTLSKFCFHFYFQIVNEGARNPGIKYSYSIPRVHSKISVKDHTLPSISKSAIEKPSKPRSKRKHNNHDKKLKPNAIMKPRDMKISVSNVPNNRNIAQTNVRIVSRRTNHYDDTSRRKKIDLENNFDTTEQFVYTNGIQVYGGDNSIRENVYKGDNSDKTQNTDVEIGQEFNNLEPQEIRYNRYPENVRTELESQGPETRTILLSDIRYMWSTGQWTPCSSKCGEGRLCCDIFLELIMF